MRRRVWVLLAVTAMLVGVMTPAGGAPAPQIEGLQDKVQVFRDVDGIPHILARNGHDMIFMQGYIHAQDRFFQMDVSRRTASGTLAELVGAAALASDIQFRTFGLRRAAEASHAVLSPEAQADLVAYADGVNAWLAANTLPPEYGALELTMAAPWTPVDSLAISKLIAFGLSFDLDIGLTEALIAYQTAGAAHGFDGTALFFEDMFRSAPFDPAVAVPDAGAPVPYFAAAEPRAVPAELDLGIAPATLALMRDYREAVKGIPLLDAALDPFDSTQGSNEWGVAGHNAVGGKPIIANDPHLALDTPSTFMQVHLSSMRPKIDVIGSSFPGAPYVILGQNRRIAWGATVNPMDVTDTYQEALVLDATSPSGWSTLFDGALEHILPIPQAYQVNLLDGVPDNPALGHEDVTLIVPRRNNGPIIAADFGAGFGLSVQYTGFSPTRETDTFRLFNQARNLNDFTEALQYFDFGSQNWMYTDVQGNLAYFTSAEMPLREDLQTLMFPDGGIPPYFIRDGTHTLAHEWLPVTTPQPGQAIPYEILPFAEMPQVVNPPAGYVVNANNDPVGTSLDNNPLNQLRGGGGLYYLNPGYASGFRAGRITSDMQARLAMGKLTRTDMKEMQANVQLLDAEVFTPYIVEAFANASAPGADPVLAALAADPGVAEAVGRLAVWDFSTPTGVPEGYDAADVDGVRSPPTAAEIDASVAATIFSVWRGQMIGNTIDMTLGGMGLVGPGSSQAVTALRHLLDSFGTNFGFGASGLDFLPGPALADRADVRDWVLLSSLAGALDLLAGLEFAPAFGGSTDQDDYRWGRLHRIELDHILGGPFSTPPAGGAFLPSFPDLPGIAVDGGFGAVDASSHSARADDYDDFMFGHGPTRRFVAGSNSGKKMKGESSMPGGPSGVLGSPWYANLLGEWLTNETHPHRVTTKVIRKGGSRTKYIPAR